VKTIDGFTRHKHCSVQPKAPRGTVTNWRFFQEHDMAKDERDLLLLLKTELDFIEKGGWAAAPGSKAPDQLSAVAKACALLLAPA